MPRQGAVSRLGGRATAPRQANGGRLLSDHAPTDQRAAMRGENTSFEMLYEESSKIRAPGEHRCIFEIVNATPRSLLPPRTWVFGFPRRTPKVSYRCRLVGARRRAGRGTANGCGQYGRSAADTAEPDMIASVCELGRSPAPTLPSLQLPRAEFTPTRSAGRGWWSYLERWTWTR